MHLLRPCAAGSALGKAYGYAATGSSTTYRGARRLLVQVLGPRLGTTASSASPGHRMTLLLSRSNNFSRHALIFPLLILTIGRSDATGTGRTDQQVSAGRLRCAEFLAPTGSPSAPPKSDEQAGRRSAQRHPPQQRL